MIRSGIRQLLKMRVDMVNLLRRSNKPKYQIIFGNPCKATQERHSLFGVGSVSLFLIVSSRKKLNHVLLINYKLAPRRLCFMSQSVAILFFNQNLNSDRSLLNVEKIDVFSLTS